MVWANKQREKQGQGKRQAWLAWRVKKIGLMRVWQLTLILLPLLFITATGLRFDHLEMIRLVSLVQEADKDGNQKKLAESLKRLKKYVSTHIIINVKEENGKTEFFWGTGPFYLENQYIRKATEELKKTEAKMVQAEGGRNIYAEASAVCQPIAIRHGWAWNSKGYIDCMMGELAKHPASPEINDLFRAVLPSTQLYRMNYASPIWAPTLAGWLILVCVVIFLLIVGRIVVWIGLRLVLFSMRKR